MARRKRKKKNNSLSVKITQFNYTDRLQMILLDISDNVSFAIMGSYNQDNYYGFKILDSSNQPGKFRLTYSDNQTRLIDIEDFLQVFFNKRFSTHEIISFIHDYNLIIEYENQDDKEYTEIDISPFRKDKFVYKPTDVLYTFTSLCYSTYPFGTESDILKFIPIPLIEDSYGNYYIKIGDSDTMFTSHFDSACSVQQNVKMFSYIENGDTFICSNGKTILSADDKSGVTVMLYMIANNVPGLYYFFIGEERGGIGSGMLVADFEKIKYLQGINKCISFDRRNYHSIITHQGWSRTASDEFAESLSEEFKKNGMDMKLDDGGMFTDSANFIKHISECTNISVGYFNEHTNKEIQNITFLENLCKACVNINWDNLVVSRNTNIVQDIMSRNFSMFEDYKRMMFFNHTRIYSTDDSMYLQAKLESETFDSNFEDLNDIKELFEKYDKDPWIFFRQDEYGTVSVNVEIE